MRQDHAFLPQNVRQKNADDMRRKTSIYGRFAVRTFCGATQHLPYNTYVETYVKLMYILRTN